MVSDDSASDVLFDGSFPLGGVYANSVSVWHSRFEFTLEFAVSLPSRPEMPDAVYVAWVKVPPSVAWRLAQELSDHVARYEAEYTTFTPRPPDEEEIP